MCFKELGKEVDVMIIVVGTSYQTSFAIKGKIIFLWIILSLSKSILYIN